MDPSAKPPAVDHQREPCPDRILDDIGGAFGMGACGGGLWHVIKGMRNSPQGYRLVGGIEAVRREAPRLGGSFAVWGGLFSAFDCTLVYARGREDPYNSIAAGALTGGFLQLRTGPRSALQSALFGGAILALIEGLGIALTKMAAPPPPSMPMPQMPGPPGLPGPGPPDALPAIATPSAAGTSTFPSEFDSNSSSTSYSSASGADSASGGGPADAPAPKRGWFGWGSSPKESSDAPPVSEYGHELAGLNAEPTFAR